MVDQESLCFLSTGSLCAHFLMEDLGMMILCLSTCQEDNLCDHSALRIARDQNIVAFLLW